VRARRKLSGEIPWGVWSWLTDQEYDPIRDQGTGRLTVFVEDHATLWNAHRAVVLAWWVREHPGTRPSLWWRFEAPAPRRHDESELAYLRRHRLLVPGEVEPTT
jgi:hypothetical protein